MPEPITLVADKISKRYGTRSVLHDVSLEVHAGEITAVIGETAAGKSTLLRLLAEVELPSSGHVRINVANSSFPPAVLVWQDLALFDTMTVVENVEFGLRPRGYTPSEIRRRSEQEMERFFIGELSARRVSELSGGQRQRVALARAFVLTPPILILDEPFSTQDAILRDQLRSELRRFAENAMVIFVSHDRDDVYDLAERIVVIDAGMVTQQGSLETVFENPQSRFATLFGGQFNLIEGGSTSQLWFRATSSAASVAIRRRLIRRVEHSVDRSIAAIVTRSQVTPEGPCKVYTAPTLSQSAPFIYYDASPTPPQPGQKVILTWPPEAEVQL